MGLQKEDITVLAHHDPPPPTTYDLIIITHPTICVSLLSSFKWGCPSLLYPGSVGLRPIYDAARSKWQWHASRAPRPHLRPTATSLARCVPHADACDNCRGGPVSWYRVRGEWASSTLLALLNRALHLYKGFSELHTTQRVYYMTRERSS